MRGLFALIGTFTLGSLGWWLGDLWGWPAAIMLGAVGSGYGLYRGRRLFDQWLGD